MKRSLIKIRDTENEASDLSDERYLTVKTLLSSWVAFLILSIPEDEERKGREGRIRGAYSQNQMGRTYVSAFPFFYTIFGGFNIQSCLSNT